MKKASLRCEETPSLFTNNAIHSPLHSERGWGVRLFFPLSVRSGEALNDHYLTSQESPPRSELTSSRMAQQ